MNNTEDILKRILLNMKYDSKKTLSENYNSLEKNEQKYIIKESNDYEDDPVYWDRQFLDGKITLEKLESEHKRIENLRKTVVGDDGTVLGTSGSKAKSKYAQYTDEENPQLEKYKEASQDLFRKFLAGEIEYSAYTEGMEINLYNINSEKAKMRTYDTGEKQSSEDVKNSLKYADALYKRGDIDYAEYLGMKSKVESGNKNVPDVKSFDFDPDYGTATYVSFQTVIPNINFTVPDQQTVAPITINPDMSQKTRSTIAMTQLNKRRLYPVVIPLEWHNKSGPFNKSIAEGLFGIACKRLSGQDPDYKLGEQSTDYYIDDDGNKCEPQVDKQYFNFSNDKTYDYAKIIYNSQYKGTGYWYRKKGTETWIRLEGSSEENIKKIDKDATRQYPFFDESSLIEKYSYKTGCSPLPYDICLRWSWKSLYELGGVDKGLKRFELYRGNKDEQGKAIKEIYSACVNIEEPLKPWEAYFSTFSDVSKMTPGTEYLGIKETDRCPDISELDLPTTPNVFTLSDNGTKIDLENGSFGTDYLKDEISNNIIDVYKGNILSNRKLNPYSASSVKYMDELTSDEVQKLQSLKGVIQGGIRIFGK